MTKFRRDDSPATGSTDEPAAAGGLEDLKSCFAALSRGETAALDYLYGRVADELYGLALWRTGSAADAADVVQEVFVRLAASKRKLASVGDPRAYLRRMAHCAAIDVHRRSTRRRETPLEGREFVIGSEHSPERRAEARKVSRLLAQLPAVQRETIYLRHFTGCSFAEIARAARVPTFTAASRYRIGMKRLRRLLGVET